MITDIIKLIQSDEWIGVSKSIEIAKGRNQFLRSPFQIRRAFKRIIKTIVKKWQKYLNIRPM